MTTHDGNAQKLVCNKCGGRLCSSRHPSENLVCTDCGHTFVLTTALRPSVHTEKIVTVRRGKRNIEPLKSTARNRLDCKMDPLKATARNRLDRKMDPLKSTARNRLDRKIEPLKSTARNRLDRKIEPLKSTARNRLDRKADPMRLTSRNHMKRIAQVKQASAESLKFKTEVVIIIFFILLGAMRLIVFPYLVKKISLSMWPDPLTKMRRVYRDYNKYPRTLEAIFQANDDNQIDFATAALLVAKSDFDEHFKSSLEVEAYLQILDRMATTIQRKITDSMSPEQVITTISTYLYQIEKFTTSQNAWDPSNLYLNLILEGKQGYCLGFVELWLALAERIQWRDKSLPIYGVLIPYHIFCRWEDGNCRRNIETLHVPPIESGVSLVQLLSELFLPTDKDKKLRKAGRNVPDWFYKKQYRITPESISKGIYLRNLSKKQVLSCIYSNRASLHLDRLQYSKDLEKRNLLIQNAQRDAREASRWYSKNILAARCKATLLTQYRRQHRRALAILQPLETIDPCAKTLCLIGRIYTYLGNEHLALQYFERAKKGKAFFAATLHQIPYYQARLYYVQQKYLQGREFCQNFIADNAGQIHAIPLVLSYLSKFHNQLGAYDKATASTILLASFVGNKHTRVLTAFGEIYQYRQLWERSRKKFEQVLDSDRSSVYALYGLAMYWQNKKHYKKAAAYLQKSIMYDPNFEQGRTALQQLQSLLVNEEQDK